MNIVFSIKFNRQTPIVRFYLIAETKRAIEKRRTKNERENNNTSNRRSNSK